MAADIIINSQTFCKMILHAAKYPHADVNGLLIAKANSTGSKLEILDCVPLFHLNVTLSPMAEIALAQVDNILSSQKLEIVGYYHAPAWPLASVDDSIHRIAAKIAENSKNACMVTINSIDCKLERGAYDRLISIRKHLNGKFVRADKGQIINLKSTLEATSLLLELQAYDELFDFDNHLDSPSCNWMNPDTNTAITEALRSTGEYEDDEDDDDDQNADGDTEDDDNE